MNFIFPTFLYALAAISIPIIIHLFNFRKHKTVLFSNITHLKNIKKETKAKSQLKHILILIARILAMASLVIAFSKPYIPVSDDAIDTNNDKVAIYIDNSFSMDADSKNGNLLEIAKSSIPDLLNVFNSNAEFLLTDNSFSAINQIILNKDELIEMTREINTSGDFKLLSQVISRQSEFFHDNTSSNYRKTQIIFSDFQKSSCDFEKINQDEEVNTILVPLSTQATYNIYIDSCYFKTPGRKFLATEELFVKIINKSEESYSNNPIKLYLNDSLRALSSFNIDANGDIIVKLSYTNTQKGIINGRIEINDYPITYDNNLFFSYEVAEKINILSISYKSENKFIDAMFKDDNYFVVTHNLETQINFSLFSQYNLIVISNLNTIPSGLRMEIETYIADGGSMLLFPSQKINMESYNQLFSVFASNKIISFDTSKTIINTIDYKNPLYENVFRKIDTNIELPEIKNHYIFEKKTRTNDEEILTSISGNSILRRIDFGLGEAYISSVPLNSESREFSEHPILLPAIYNMALNNSGNNKLYHIIGRDKTIKINELSYKETPLHLINKSINFDLLPESQVISEGIILYIDNNIVEPGNYYLVNNEDFKQGLAFNYNRKESDLNFYSEEELDQLLTESNLNNFSILENDNEQLSTNLNDLQHGIQLWKLFILLTLLFILIEIGIIKFMNRN